MNNQTITLQERIRQTEQLLTCKWHRTNNPIAISNLEYILETLKHKQKRLKYLRKELRAERMSSEEIAELQSLIPDIDKDDVELLEAAGVPELAEENTGIRKNRNCNVCCCCIDIRW